MNSLTPPHAGRLARMERTRRMCECIKLTNDALKPLNTELNLAHLFTGGGGIRTVVDIGTSLIEKKRGERAKSMIPNYCPFCGEAYETSQPNAAADDRRVSE